MKKALALFLIVLIFGVVGTANAALTTIGTASYDSDGNGTPESYNLIYEDDSIDGGLVWLDFVRDDASWQDQLDWAAGLGSNLIVSLDPTFTADIDWATGWRLPKVGDSPQVGVNMTTSEFGHLYYESIGNIAYDPTVEIAPFSSIRVGLEEGMWTEDEVGNTQGDIWCFGFNVGFQGYNLPGELNNAMAVRPGIVSAVPIPSAVWLLGSGLIGIVGFRRKFRRETTK